MKTRINPTTGNVECAFAARVDSISDKLFENANGTQYRVANVTFTDKSGQKQTVSSMVYEKNFQLGMEEGKSYLTIATKTDQGVFVHTSHLAAAERAEISMFDFDTVSQGVTSEVTETAFEQAQK